MGFDVQLIDLIPRAGTRPLVLAPLLESDVFALWEENILTGRVRPPREGEHHLPIQRLERHFPQPGCFPRSLDNPLTAFAPSTGRAVPSCLSPHLFPSLSPQPSPQPFSAALSSCFPVVRQFFIIKFIFIHHSCRWGFGINRWHIRYLSMCTKFS